MPSPLQLSRDQVLAHRLRANALDARLPAPDAASLRRAAWAGLTDSVPRAALLSLHARVAGIGAGALDDPALVQVWGPRFSAYAVPAEDAGVLTLGRMPDAPRKAADVTGIAEMLAAFLGDRRMSYADAGHAMGVDPNRLRYATLTGRVRIWWDGARRPEIWMVPAPAMSPLEARLELARRFLHVLGPGDARGFGEWAGIRPPRAASTMHALEPELAAVGTPVGERWILASDEASFRSPATPPSPTDARLLPSGDAFWLLSGADRELLVGDADRRAALWTSRVWPGAILLGGEIVGTWRRSDAALRLAQWRELTDAERDAVEAEALALPLPGLEGRLAVGWDEA